MTSTNSVSASLPGTQTHSQSNPRFREAVLHIVDSWPPPERVSNFLKGAFSLTVLQNPEQHALRNDSTWASSEGDDLKILMMFDHRCTALSHLSSQLPPVVCTRVYLEPWSCWLHWFEEHKLMTCREQAEWNRLLERMAISCYKTADGRQDKWDGQDVRNRKWEKYKYESAVDLQHRI